MEVLRRSCQISRKGHIINEIIREMMELGHIRRFTEKMKKREKPRRLWGENVRKAVSERNLRGEEYYDRKLWTKKSIFKCLRATSLSDIKQKWLYYSWT